MTIVERALELVIDASFLACEIQRNVGRNFSAKRLDGLLGGFARNRQVTLGYA